MGFMHIHIVAVAGTGMGALAGLLSELGHQVSGSDVAFDPPMGPALESWGVRCLRGFDPKHLEPDLALDARHQVDGEPARAATSAVRHRHVRRIVRLQAGHGLEQTIDPRFILRREKLKGKGGGLRRKLVDDFHERENASERGPAR